MHFSTLILLYLAVSASMAEYNMCKVGQLECECQEKPPFLIYNCVKETGYDSLPDLTRILPSNRSTILKIRNNRFKKLNKKFLSGCLVVDLDLSNNQIDFIDDEAFLTDTSIHLTSIILEANRLRNVSFLRYANLLNLTLLNLAWNSIYMISNDTFVGMKMLRRLNLAFNEIEDLESHAFGPDLSQLQYLLLKSNRLSSIHPNSFIHLASLIVLNLQDNFIEFISMRLFERMTSLSDLYLERNKIKRLDHSSSLTFTIYNIYLSENDLARVDGITFNGLNNTKILSISRNKLKYLDQGSFFGLWDLRVLYLNDNKLTLLVPNIFMKLTNLNSLVLTNNLLGKLAKGTFNGLEMCLQNLQLEKNKLNYIKWFYFHGLIRLRTLHLNANQISSLEANSFNSLISLKTLFLNDNALHRIDPLLFASLLNLQNLYLQQNRLIYLSRDLFRNLSTLRVLDLTGNLLYDLDENLFRFNFELRNLKIGENFLTENNSLNVLKHMKSLEILHLNKNQFTIVNLTKFADLTLLKEINLSENENLKHVEFGMHQKLISGLSLSYTKSLESLRMNFTPHFKSIHLKSTSYALLSTLNFSLFSHDLAVLDLSLNDLSLLSDNLPFNYMTKLTRLFLSGTKLKISLNMLTPILDILLNCR